MNNDRRMRTTLSTVVSSSKYIVALIRAVCLGFVVCTTVTRLSTFSTDASCQLDVLWHDGDTLGVDGAQVGVFEESDQISFAGLLKSHDGGTLESEVGLEVLCDFTDESLEGQLADEQFGALLVTSDFSESDCAWPVTMWLLHSSGSWGALASCLGGQLFSWGLASGRFASSLLGTSHFRTSKRVE